MSKLKKSRLYTMVSNISGLPVDDYLKPLLEAQKENEWFCPGGEHSILFNICGFLFGRNLMARKKIPLYNKDGKFEGFIFYFFFNLDLDFSKA